MPVTGLRSILVRVVSAIVEITAVRLPGRSSPQVVDCALDQPSADTSRASFTVELRGWVSTSSAPPRAVRVVSLNERSEAVREVVCVVPVDIPRPDVRNTSADEDATARGFAVEIGALRLPTRFRLELRLVLEDATNVKLAEVEGTRQAIRPPTAPVEGDLRPAVIVTTGRSGSTWLSYLLNQHPALVAYGPFKREPRVAAYWLEIAQALSDPASYKQSLQPNFGRGQRWWLGDWPEASRAPLNDGLAEGLLGRETPEALVELARQRVQAFYDSVAHHQGKHAPAYFVEKSPGLRPRAMEFMAEAFPGLRDIVLLRDPRDVLCSILAYKQKNPNAVLVRKDPGLDSDFLERMAGTYRAALAYMRLAGERAILVRYEDLVEDPAKTLAAMLAHLGVDQGNGTIATMVDARQAGMEVHQTAPSVEQSIGRWRRDLSDGDQSRANDAFEEALVGLGYE